MFKPSCLVLLATIIGSLISAEGVGARWVQDKKALYEQYPQMVNQEIK